MLRPKVEVLQAGVKLDDLAKFDHNAFFYSYLVDGHVVRAMHWSGKYNGPVEELASHLAYLMVSYRLDYLTTTESQQKGVLRAIRKELLDNFGRGVYGLQATGEYVLIFSRKSFRVDAKRKPYTLVRSSVRRIASWRQFHVGVFNIHHKASNRPFRILDIHGPSHIEMGPNFRPGSAQLVAKEGWPRVGRMVRRSKRYFPRRVNVVVGDANGNQFIDAWMRWFENQIGLKSIWRGRRPRYGTHGRRLIDGAWIEELD